MSIPNRDYLKDDPLQIRLEEHFPTAQAEALSSTIRSAFAECATKTDWDEAIGRLSRRMTWMMIVFMVAVVAITYLMLRLA